MDQYITVTDSRADERHEPFFTHDAPHQFFVGSFLEVKRGRDLKFIPHDVWLSRPDKEGARPLVIVRDGSDGVEYSSFPREMVERFYTEIPRESFGYWHHVVEMIHDFYSNVRPLRNNAVCDEEATMYRGGLRLVRSGRHYTSPDGSSLRAWFVYEPSLCETPDVERQRAWIENAHGATRCQHSYDCCGHWYNGSPTITHLPNGKWLVASGAYMNI